MATWDANDFKMRDILVQFLERQDEKGLSEEDAYLLDELEDECLGDFEEYKEPFRTIISTLCEKRNGKYLAAFMTKEDRHTLLEKIYAYPEFRKK